jgi:hypothetical protein
MYHSLRREKRQKTALSFLQLRRARDGGGGKS